MTDPSRLNVVLGYKNFAAYQGISHIGLGVSMTNISKVLQQNGIQARVLAIRDPIADTNRVLDNDPSITHMVIGAPWIPTTQYSYLCDQYPQTQFVLNCHSNVGFLQADSGGIALMREAMQLEAGKYNFHLAGNSAEFCRTIIDGYGAPCTFLPNLYYLDHTASQTRPLWDGGTLRLGIFGATRWQKNFLTAAAGALLVSRALKAETEIYINSARVDGPEVARILGAVQNLVKGVPGLKMLPVPWAPWPDFRGWVDSMHCMIQPSYTESYNLVTADGCSRGVPSAVSPAIDWVPESWQTEVDDAPRLAETITALVRDPQAARRGLQALQAKNAHGLDAWTAYLVDGMFGVGDARWTALGVPKNYRIAA